MIETALRGGRVWTMVAGLLCLLATSTRAQDQDAAAAAADSITVKLVTDFESAKLVSDLERLEPVTDTIFTPNGPRTLTKGVNAELWVRNAHIDGKFFFERYYEGKYIGREAKLSIKRADLGVGEHVIEPGGHRFSMAEDGTLSSDDPSIRVEGDTVMLRLHRVSVMALDDAKRGLPSTRLVGAELAIFELHADAVLDPAALPNARGRRVPRDPKSAKSPLMAVLSHAEPWYPLHVWLPANTVGQGYVIYPAWQAFHVTDAGEVQLSAAKAPSVPGVVLEGSAIHVPYRDFTGRVNTTTGLSAGVGNVKVGPEMKFSATVETVTFRAGFGKLDESFALPVDTDFDKLANKYFVADNTSGDPEAIRLMVLEWADAIFTSGGEATLGLRLLETPEKITLKSPTVRLSYSIYDPREPGKRVWQDGEVLEWTNGVESGTLRVRVPALPPGFIHLRVAIADADAPQTQSSLWAELPAAIVAPGQTGSASIASERARDAFQVGETIALDVILRSQAPRAAGNRTLVLTGPDGSSSRTTIADDGATWRAVSVEIGSEQSRALPPGRYTLTVEDLPAGILPRPFVFDLVPRHRQSEFDVIKPSKYTKDMNNLVPSHLHDRVGLPVNMDRAAETIADLGYTKIDLMTYITNHHVRTYTWREDLASGDPRLPAPAAVYQPSPRSQLLNGAVRHGLLFSDVLLSYNDFWVPRYIEGYTNASVRWFARELQDMRHSPAMDGIMIYEEKYPVGISGIVEGMQKEWADTRHRRATKELGESPAKIASKMQRFVARPKSQREPADLQTFLRYGDWEQHSWAAFVNPHAAIADQIAPEARIGTYHRTMMGPGENDDIYHGYVPDLFKNLEIVGQVHYADNSTGWVHVPMIARLMRFGTGKYVVPNTPVTHEHRTQNDGQYQRLMAFAMLSQGANGVSLWGVDHSFSEGPNPKTLKGRETTKHLNERVLKPYADLINHAEDAYAKVGIVSVLSSQVLSPFKNIGMSHQSEELWVSCWRAGYVAHFLREEHFERPLTSYQVIFVPNIRYDGELTDAQLERLREAIAAGTKVVVERGSELQLEGLIRLEETDLTAHYLGKYFPTWQDDELKQVYETTEKTTALLKRKFEEWGTEPAGSGDFQVGPSWWQIGDAHYLIMANYNDPPYRHTVKQQMAEPIVLDLKVPARHGAVAYDLLAMKEIPVPEAGTTNGHAMRQVSLDMTQIQGAMVAFLPARIGGLNVERAVSADGRSVRLSATLLDAAGKPMDAGFPVEIEISRGGENTRRFYRTLGRGRLVDLDLPTAGAATAKTLQIRVIERITGRVVTDSVAAPAPVATPVTVVSATTPRVPFPADLARFLAQTTTCRIIVADESTGLRQQAEALAAGLKTRGIDATIVLERDAWTSSISGDPTLDDPFNDGFHTWRKGQHVIAPGMHVDSPAILLGARAQSRLVDGLVDNGFVSVRPNGQLGQAIRPSVQLATRGLSPLHDTLCLIAETDAAMAACVARVLATPAAATPPPTYGTAVTITDSKPQTDLAVARDTVGNNSYINGLTFDEAGNVYLITWGHGDNLYALAADGTPRYSRFLPEMGTTDLRVVDGEIWVYTRAGAKLYRLTTDNKPIWQAQLNRDPGSVHYRDEYGLSWISYQYLPKQKKIVHAMKDSMRVFDMDLNMLAEWSGESFEDKDVSDDVMTRMTGEFVVSPDGTRIAQLERSRYYTKDAYKDDVVYDSHVVLRDLSGKLLAEYKNLDNFKAGSDPDESMEWPAGAPGPIVTSGNRRIRFAADLTMLSELRSFEQGHYLGGGERLLTHGRHLLLVDESGTQHAQFGPFAPLPTVIARSADGGSFAFEDEYGVISVWESAEGGRQVATWTTPEMGEKLAFSPDGSRVILGGLRGGVYCWSRTGELIWQQDIKPMNKTLYGSRPLYDESIPDRTERVWPRIYDTPGELDALVRMGEDRLVNGDMEADTGWQGEAVAYAAPAVSGTRSLKVGASMVGQEVTGYLGRHVTWVLEFQYRAVDPSQPASILAGVRIDNKFPDSVARTYRATRDWKFGRVVLKNGLDCERLSVGFLARAGEVLVDDVQLRQIRFPSVNHMLYEPLYNVKPVILTEMFHSPNYDPFGNVREDAPNRIMVSILSTGTPNLVESAFLQNGRLNDVGSKWYVQPYRNPLTVAMALKEPRWVNMVVLYFNAYDPENVLPHFDIYATNVETGKEDLVASVRHNTQVFRVVKFDPVKTPMISLRPVDSIRRQRTITEIEIYGPLSGQEGVAGFLDPAGQSTWMGDFSRVEKRTLTVPPVLGQSIYKRHGHHERDIGWRPVMTQVLAADGMLYAGRALGMQDSMTLADPLETVQRGQANVLGFSPYGSLYGGLILRHGVDGRLYCNSPETGAALWSVKLGERLYGSPVAIGEDVYSVNETGTLYQVDLANGSIMRDVSLSAGTHGSLTTDGTRLYFATDDGLLHARNASDLSAVWTVPIGPDSDATPAVDGGVVYYADMDGRAIAVDAATGKVRWQSELGREFKQCPVVMPTQIAYGCRDGMLVVLDRATGKRLWERQFATRFLYEPLWVNGKDLLIVDGGVMKLMPANGKGDPVTVQWLGKERGDKQPVLRDATPGDPIMPITWYQGALVTVPRHGDDGHTVHQVNYQWHVVGGSITVWHPPAEPTDEKKEAGK